VTASPDEEPPLANVRIAGQRDGRPTCPYCRDLAPASPLLCDACGAPYHPSCWDELGGCATLGCVGVSLAATCSTCRRGFGQHDLVLCCAGCSDLHHADCAIPGARCPGLKCEGTLEYRKAAEGRDAGALEGRCCWVPGCVRPWAPGFWSSRRRCAGHQSHRWFPVSDALVGLGLAALLPSLFLDGGQAGVWFLVGLPLLAAAVSLHVLGGALDRREGLLAPEDYEPLRWPPWGP
jgi:hypothetical protein